MKVRGLTVIHRVAWVNRRRGLLVTWCGQRRPFSDTLLPLAKLPACSHCRDRWKPKRPR